MSLPKQARDAGKKGAAMLIGVPKEIKDHEFRVGITPAGVKALVAAGHEVTVETGAGARIGFGDETYRAEGARIVASAAEAYACPMVVKVKEPQPAEIPLLREGQVLFTYLHLAADAELTDRLLERKIVGIAYETVTDASGGLPLLTPMSEVAGRVAVQAGAAALQMANGGSGVLLGGVPGVSPGRVVILGGGTVGTNAAKMALGLGAEVTLLDISLPRLRYLDDVFGLRLRTRYAEAHAIEELVPEADLVVGAVLVPGKKAPRLLSRETIGRMRPGSVLVDVAIDQGGCSETSRPTSHSAPTYIKEGVVHYCVTNMPAACARTATQALTAATLPYVLQLAGKGWQQALMEDPGLRAGLNLHLGQVTHPSVAADLGHPYVAPEMVLA
jgi:alanine dehydrogenase